MKLRNLILIISLIALFSCEKDEIQNKPHIYSNKVLIDNLPPVMGGFVDYNGDLKTFSLPILGENQFSDILLTAKINNITTNGLIEEIHEFANNPFSFGSWSKDTMADIYGWIPNGIRVDMTARGQDDIIMSFNWGKYLYVYSDNYLRSINVNKGITSLTTNSKKEVFFIGAPTYTGEYPSSLITPPIIYKLDTFNGISEFYRFSESETYEHSGSAGSASAMYPTNILINMTCDKEDNLFICFGYDNIIYKLDKDKVLYEYITDIYCPTSIAFDRNNIPYVLSGAKFSKSEDFKFTMEKPLELLKLIQTRKEIIYTGGNSVYLGGFKLDLLGEYYTKSDANFNISINQQNYIFLENPLKGEVIMIK